MVQTALLANGTFWNSKDIPIVVKGCIQSWKTSNPEYTINILNLDNYQGYLQFKPNFSMKDVIPAHQADWIRIAVLAEHGGIWLDASIIVTESLNSLLNVPKTEGIMFSVNSTINEPFPLLDNWFIATIPSGLMITAWLFELSYAMRISATYLLELRENYGQDIYNSIVKHIDNGQDDQSTNYFRANVALQKVIQIHSINRFNIKQAEQGPMKKYSELNWNGVSYAQSLLSNWDEAIPTMFKLTHHCRDSLVSLIEKGEPIHSNSIYARFLINKT